MQRAMGEFGAVSVISGNIIGRTQTLTLYVEGAYKVGIPSWGWQTWEQSMHSCWRRCI